MGGGDLTGPGDPGGEGEGSVLAALAVFAGGFTIESARAVVGSEHVDEAVADLADRGLLSVTGVPPRYRLAGGPRAGPDEATRRRHLDWACTLAQEGAAALDGPRQDTWLDALESERANFTAALEWGTARPDCEPALALAAALGRFWEVRGPAREGRRWLDAALRNNPGAEVAVRARAYGSAGLLALRDGDLDAARSMYEQALAQHWEADDRLGASATLHALGNVAFQRYDLDQARKLFEESLALGRDLRDDRVVAASLTNLGAVAEVRGDHAGALALYDEALTLWQAAGDRFNAAAVLGNLADVAMARKRPEDARRYAAEALEARRAVGDRGGMAAALGQLAAAARAQGDTEAARSFAAERRRMAGEAGGGWWSRATRWWRR